ncbi:MAG: SAM-dependent methyltransferase [Firmicutes bacterium HGW-Firmicutes-1]|nr:MAG: SAM-dependent methyltransferase [Firmicutes bacterium HGW-Firmicutes-1]
MTLPEQYKNKMKTLLEDNYEAYIASFDKVHYQGLRSNDIKIDPSTFLKIAPFQLEPIVWADNGFYYSNEEKPAKHPYYHAGLFYIQEPSAMVPASILPIQKGDKVLDLCAAPGGKSTQIGARLGNTGLLVSNDISPSRAKAIVKNIELFGIRNAIVLSEAPDKLVGYFEGFFDKVLVDAPCSGEGMFRKDSSMVKNWLEYGVSYYEAIQKEILPSAAKMLKPNGYMAYSTCTFSSEENEKMIEWFLNTNSNFELVDIESIDGFENGREGLTQTKRLWPHKIKGEGHFVALLHKIDDNPTSKYRPFSFEKTNEKQLSSYLDFEKDVLSCTLDKNRMIIIQDKLYLLPEHTPDLKGLRIQRSGWYLGEFKNYRFEPSQAFASGLYFEEIKKLITIPVVDHNVIKYLKGESLNLDAPEGYNMVCVDDYPLGWAKKTGNILKNKYCAGWRWQ